MMMMMMIYYLLFIISLVDALRMRRVRCFGVLGKIENEI
jgi:hypothetical protein